MLVRKTVIYKGTKGDSKEGDKRNKGYKKVNCLKVSLKKAFVKFIYIFRDLNPVK